MDSDRSRMRAEKGVVMNRTLTGIALAFLVGLAFAFPETGPEIVAKGKVLAVSAEARTLTLEEVADDSSPDATQSGVRREFVVNDATKLTAEGAEVELGDIAVGALATVRYVMDQGKNVALVIEVRSPATD